MKSTNIEVSKNDQVSESKEIAVAQPKNNQVLQPVDMESGSLPSLDDATEIPFDLMSNYWSPTRAGEVKRVFFDTIRIRQVQDQQSPEVLIDLPCAYFFEQVNGQVQTISNGSKRLVGLIESLNIQRGTPLQIAYNGKKKNATNGFHSDDWSVKPLMIKSK